MVCQHHVKDQLNSHCKQSSRKQECSIRASENTMFMGQHLMNFCLSFMLTSVEMYTRDKDTSSVSVILDSSACAHTHVHMHYCIMEQFAALLPTLINLFSQKKMTVIEGT